jgi:hypothetical protein
MEKINVTYSSKENNSRTIDYRGQGDLVMGEVMDLIDDSRYLPFFYKRLNAIGPSQFLAIAHDARKTGFNKGRQFVNLLKKYSEANLTHA